MWWITLIIAAVLFIAFSAFLKLSYVKSYSGPMGELSLSIAKSYATFSPLFKFSPNFLDIILSLLYKLILFIIAALCVHFLIRYSFQAYCMESISGQPFLWQSHVAFKKSNFVTLT